MLDLPPPSYIQVDGFAERTRVLRKLETKAGRAEIMRQGLSGNSTPTAQAFLDRLERISLLRASQRLAEASGRTFELIDASDLEWFQRASGREAVLLQLTTVSGRAEMARDIERDRRDPSKAPVFSSPLGLEMVERVEALATPAGLVEQIRQARDYARATRRAFEALQPREALLSPGFAQGGPAGRQELLRVAQTVDGRLDLIAESKRFEFRAEIQVADTARREILAMLQDPTARDLFFLESEAVAAREGRPFESLDRDRAFYAGQDRARSEMLRDLSFPQGRAALFSRTRIDPQSPAGLDLSESAGFESERRRLIKALADDVSRERLIEASERRAMATGRAFVPVTIHEPLGFQRSFQPAMGRAQET